MRKREDRRRVLVRARLKAGSEWHDVTIRNVSSRGMMVETPASLDRGDYVEIRRGADTCIVGRIVWRRGYACGLRTQDVVPISRLLDAPAAKPAPAGAAIRNERRSTSRERAERSRTSGHLMQHAALAVAVAAAAAVAGQTAYQALSKPLAVVGTSLSSNGEPT